MDRVFLLSPARTTGVRAGQLLRPGATSPIARQLARGEARLGDVMASLSSLYFRGKLAYARRFGVAAGAIPSALVITAGRGLLLPETKVGDVDLHAMCATPIDDDEERFTGPLRDHALALDARLRGQGDVVLLGSVASSKYTATLVDVFGPRLLFPQDFVGRGDLSRGGLLLRAVEAGVELPYAPVVGAVTKGRRPPRLAKRT